MSRFFKSFKFALNGLKYAFKSELNFKVHLFVGALTLVAGGYFKISQVEWIAVAFCIGSVLFAELINTAIEALVDWVSPEFNQKAGRVKDIAAGAVFIIALMSLVVGLVIFVPKIF